MIASRGFLFMCDHHIENPESESKRLPTTFPSKDGETIYIHPTAIRKFVDNYLPNLKYKFILLSGDSDTTVPTDIQTEADIVLNHPLLVKWYSQNSIPSEKLCQLPIGLYFHVIYSPEIGWHKIKNIEYYENIIKSLRSNPKINKCYSNFHFLINTRYAQDRRDAMLIINPSLVFYEPKKISSVETWKTMSMYKYIISPHGNGLDCHRTWEAIALGCIPIVKTSQLDPLFSGLPVLIVSDWSDVTQELLDKFIPNYSEIQKMKLSYWNKIFKE